MSPKARRTAGLVLIWVVGLALIAGAASKLTNPAALAGRLGGSAYVLLFLFKPLALGELGSAVLLLVPQTRRLGLLLCTVYLGGAMAVWIVVEGLAGALPAAVLQALLLTGATLAKADLLAPMLPRGVPVAPAGAAGDAEPRVPA